jgi:adenylate cyclase
VRPALVKSIPLCIVAGVLGVVYLLQSVPSWLPGARLFQRLEWITYDWRVRSAAAAGPVRDAALAGGFGFVYTDEHTIEQLHAFLGESWPIARYLHGMAAEELTAQGARQIAFDILFLDPQRRETPTRLEVPGRGQVTSDEFLAIQMQRARNVVLAVARHKGKDDDWTLKPPIDLFRTNAAGLGHVARLEDPDGVLRRIQPFVEDPSHGRFWHLGIVLAARMLGLDLSQAEIRPEAIVLRTSRGSTTTGGAIGTDNAVASVERILPLDETGRLFIDWSLPVNHPRLHQEPLLNVLASHGARAAGHTNIQPVWRGRTVVIGSLAIGGNVDDRGVTPLATATPLSSSIWNVANAVVQGRFVRRSSYATETALATLLALVAAGLSWKLRAGWASIGVLAAAASYIALAVWAFHDQRYWLPIATPVAGALLMTHACMVVYRMLLERMETPVRSAFGRLVSPNVIQRLLQEPQRSLGGSRRRVSIYFADVRGFTQFTDERQLDAERRIKEGGIQGAAAEALMDGNAQETLETVNLYLSTIADTIKEHNGTLDKYIGDCVMAFWGAPVAEPRHATACVRAAIAVQQAIAGLNVARAAENEQRAKANELAAAQDAPLAPPLPILTVGSAINSGPAIVGFMGSAAHISNYTVFGREVNIAYRLEAASGSGRILITGATFEALEREDPALAATCRKLPPANLRGIQQPVPVYEVPCQPFLTG